MTHSRIAFTFVWLLLLTGQGTSQTPTKSINTIETSRRSTVEVLTNKTRLGSGFIIMDQYVATAFHVVAAISESITETKWSLAPNLKVRLPDGETIDATCVTLPTEADSSPLIYDFAVLKLKTKPRANHIKVHLRQTTDKISVGDKVIFSGYPLDAPFMHTLRGLVSGFDASNAVIGLQSSVNKGNSGGALLASNGRAVGIMTLREGGISKEMEALAQRIAKRKVAVTFDGIDPLSVGNAIIATLDRYISTGIGYAYSTQFLADYIAKHPEITKGD